jgi:molybdopterin-binding protein
MISYKIGHTMTATARGPLTPADAAKLLGVSYQTVKQWIYRKRIRSVRTPGGHHRIPASEIRRLGATPGPARTRSVAMDAISGRNKLLGTVTRIRESGLLAEVTLEVAGQTLTAIITKAAVRQLGLKAGSPAYALIKATEVMLIRA